MVTTTRNLGRMMSNLEAVCLIAPVCLNLDFCLFHSNIMLQSTASLYVYNKSKRSIYYTLDPNEEPP